MDTQRALHLAEKVLTAWNAQDVERVVACYTEDCRYLDPNTRGPVVGHAALRRYLTRLFGDWRMHWSLRELFAFGDDEGGAFLWRAELTPAAGGYTATIDGMDLILLQGDRLSRNEVYFDRTVLVPSK